MKTTRAYLAGFGSASTLVIAAAALFVLGSAVVAFDGWPTLGAGVAPMTQVVTVHRRSHPRHGHAVSPKVATVADPAVAPPATLVVSRTVTARQVEPVTSTGRRGGTHHASGSNAGNAQPVPTSTASGQGSKIAASTGSAVPPSPSPVVAAGGTVTTVVTTVTGILNKVTGAGNRVIGPGKKLGILKKLAGLVGPTGNKLNEVSQGTGEPLSGLGQNGDQNGNGNGDQTVNKVTGPVGTVLSGISVATGGPLAKITRHINHERAASGGGDRPTVSTTPGVGRGVGHAGQSSGQNGGDAGQSSGQNSGDAGQSSGQNSGDASQASGQNGGNAGQAAGRALGHAGQAAGRALGHAHAGR